MKCRECGGAMEIIPGPYRFTSSGLDNVYLQGEGVAHRRCPACGEESVEIHAMGPLLGKIARMVAGKSDRLTGGEIRFLRKSMRMRANEFAGLAGISAEALSRIENGHDPVSAQVDRIVRLIHRDPDGAAAQLAPLTGARNDAARWEVIVHGNDEFEVSYG